MAKAPQEQVRIAAIAGANDFTLANNRGVQSTSSKKSNESTAAAAESSQAATSAKSKPGAVPQQQEELFDSDDDMYNRKFEPGQPIDFSQSDRWYQGTIEIVLDEMVKCVSTSHEGNQPLIQWVELESDRLAPPNSHCSNDREHLHNVFKMLSQHVSRSSR